MTATRQRTKPREAAPLLVHAGDGSEFRLRVKPASVRTWPESVLLDLDWAYIPVFQWRSLPVLMQRSQPISLIERFTLTAATELGSLSAAELSDLTALPQRAIRPLLGRLLTAGALEPTGDDVYIPTPVAASILTDEQVDVPYETVEDFAYFPHTDELLVLTGSPRSPRKRLLDPKLHAVLQAPVDESVIGRARSEIVNRHLGANTAHWRPPGLIRALSQPEEELVGDLCPVFQAMQIQCRYSEETATHRVQFVFRTGRKTVGQDEPSAPRPDPAGADLRIMLTGVDGLIGQWFALADTIKDPAMARLIWEAVAGPDSKLDPAELSMLRIEEVRSPRYAMWVPEAAVLELQRCGVGLSDIAGIRVQAEQATALFRLELRPADDRAAALFALDEAAQRLRSGESSGYREAMEAAAEHVGLPPDSDLLPGPERVRARLWELRSYQAVYKIREHDDFWYV